MADEATASAEPTGVGGPAPGGPPADPGTAGTQAPAAGGTPEAPATAGTPEGWPEVPEGATPEVGAPPTEPGEPEIDYRQRFADTKVDRDKMAQQLKQLREQRIIDESGNLLVEIEEDGGGYQAPQPRPEPTQAQAGMPPQIAAIIDRVSRETWNRTYEEILAEHGPVTAQVWLNQAIQAQQPHPQQAIPSGQQMTPQMVQQLAVRAVQPQLVQARQFGRRVDRELTALDSELPGFLDEQRPVNGVMLSRRDWLEDACLKRGLAPKQALANFDPEAYIKAQVEARFSAELLSREQELSGDGGPIAGMPGIPQATDDELDIGDEYARKLGARTEDKGPLPAPGFGD